MSDEPTAFVPRRRVPRAADVAWAALRTLSTVLLATVLIVPAVFVNLDTAVMRRVVIARVNQLVFAPLFKGTFVIVGLEHVDPFGVSGASVRISDAAGQPVIIADGVRGRFGTFALLRSLVRSVRDPVIDLPDITIGNADVRLDLDDSGVAIANAFVPRTPSTEPSTPPDGHGVRVYAPRIKIQHAWGHGQMTGLPYFDADLTGLDAAFALGPSGLTVDARKGKIVARGIVLGQDASGSFHGRYGMTLETDPVIGGSVSWDGTVGSLAETALFGVDKGRLDARLDIREASPEAIRSLWSGSPIAATGNAHFEAHGPLTNVETTGHAGLGAASVDVRGAFGWGLDKTVSLHVETEGIDLHELADAASVSSLAATGDVSAASHEDGTVEARVDLNLQGGRIGSQRVPPTTVKASVSRAPTGGFGGDAKVVIEEPSAPTTVTIHAVPTARSSRLDFTIASQVARLDVLRRLEAEATGSARVRAKGSLDLDTLALNVDLDSDLRTLGQGSLQIDSAQVEAHGKGSLADPRVDVVLHAEGIHFHENTLAALDVTVRGRAFAPHVSVHERSRDVPDLDAELDVDLRDGPALRRIFARVSHAGEVGVVRADRVRWAHGNVDVDDVVLEGLGAPATMSFDLTGDTLRLFASAPRLDLGRLAKLLRVDAVVHQGTLVLDADVSLRAQGASGRVRVKLEHASVLTVDDAAASIEGRLDDRTFVGTVSVLAGDLGSLTIDAKKLVMGGTAPLAKPSWKNAWGDVTLQGHVDLAKVETHLPEGRSPFSAMAGTVDIQGRLERDSLSDFTPLVELEAGTRHLLLSGKPVPGVNAKEAPVPGTDAPARVADGRAPGAAAPMPPPWTVKDVDLKTSVHVNGDTGFLDFVAHVADGKGDLAVLDVKSGAVPYRELYASLGGALEKLPGLAFDAHLVLPRRALTTWPSIVGRLPVEGDLEADATLKGPLTTPALKVTAKLGQASSVAARLTSAVELDVTSTYDGSRADLNVHGRQGSHEVLVASAQAFVRADDLLSGNPDLAWKASTKVHVEQFPLVTIGPLDDRQIRGRLTGDLEVDDLHADAKGHAAVSVKSLTIGDAVYPTATASLRADGKNMGAELRLDQSDGYLSAKANVVAKWGASLWPVADPSRTLGLELHAKHFKAGSLLPFVQGSVDELDGFIDAEGQATVDPRTQEVGLQGSLSLTEGLFELAAFGGELHDIAAKVTLTPGGVLTLDRLTAHGVSGELQAAATARLKGLHLVTASAVVQIPKSRPLPISASGAPLGLVDGKFNVTETLSADRKDLEIKVDVPSLQFVLPENGSQDVQVLGDMPGVVIGSHVGSTGEFVANTVNSDEDRDDTTAARAAGAMTVRVATKLGNDVVIRRGTDLRVELAGGPTVTVSDKSRVTGQIQLHGGVINLYGKTFQIEHGTVTFVGDDPSNPQVSVTAGFTASDGTQIYADFIGPLKTGKVTLRSEPSLSRNDIVQLLLFGTTDGQTAAGQPPAGTSSALGAAGSQATQPLNRALDQFGLSAVSARVDSSSVEAKPEVEVQIAKNISVELAHILYIGPPPPGSAPDTTLLTVDWRFLRKWSLEATVGNAGSTIVDLVWLYRY